jgi:hypothetical protein
LADGSVRWPSLLELTQFHQKGITALQVLLVFCVDERAE